MLTVRARIAAMVARWALFERKREATGTSRLPLRCWVTDCDFNVHMNNSRYLALMDMGRWHYCFSQGVMGFFWRHGWKPVAVRVEIDFKRAIRPFERFDLETFLSERGHKSATFTQRFWVGQELAAEARVVVVCRGGGRTQEIAPMFEELPACAARLAEKTLVNA